MSNTTRIRIHVTKEILRKSMMCGTISSSKNSSSCAIALAVRDIFPKADIQHYYMEFDNSDPEGLVTDLPREAQDFINEFDCLFRTPHERLNLPELSFDIDVPNEVIERIGLDEVHRILKESETLSLV